MKIQSVCICGESDHPLLAQFKNHYANYNPIVQLGVTNRWLKTNGDTSGSGKVFGEKVDQQNAGLNHVDPDTDYIMTFDVDEFISHGDLADIIRSLELLRPDVVSFRMNQFWHHEGYIGVGGIGWGYDMPAPRIFRHVPGMQFTNHRPPTLSHPCPDLVVLPQLANHYSYVYMNQVYRKLKYYNLIYPQFDYMEWFNEVWMKWNPINRKEIESKWSVHPSCTGATTRLFTGKHEIEW